jgi:hypothetical protein
MTRLTWAFSGARKPGFGVIRVQRRAPTRLTLGGFPYEWVVGFGTELLHINTTQIRRRIMMKMLVIVIIVIAMSSVALGQMKTSRDTNNSVEAPIIALEKQAWEAWKKSNGVCFQSYLTDDAVGVRETGIVDKSQIVKAFSSGGCEVKSFSLDNFKLVMLEKKTVILIYKAMQDVTCNGKTMPAAVRASTVFVKRGGKWLAAFHQEIPAAQ